MCSNKPEMYIVYHKSQGVYTSYTYVLTHLQVYMHKYTKAVSLMCEVNKIYILYIYIYIYILNSYTIGMSGLPDA